MHVELDDRRCFTARFRCAMGVKFWQTPKNFMGWGHYRDSFFFSQWHSWDSNLRHVICCIVRHLVFQLSHAHIRCELLGTSCSVMGILRCQFLDDPPPCIPHQEFYSKRHIYARIIALCTVDIISETFSIIFKCKLLCFLHVGRLEHHATAPVASLPK